MTEVLIFEDRRFGSILYDVTIPQGLEPAEARKARMQKELYAKAHLMANILPEDWFVAPTAPEKPETSTMEIDINSDDVLAEIEKRRKDATDAYAEQLKAYEKELALYEAGISILRDIKKTSVVEVLGDDVPHLTVIRKFFDHQCEYDFEITRESVFSFE